MRRERERLNVESQNALAKCVPEVKLRVEYRGMDILVWFGLGSCKRHAKTLFGVAALKARAGSAAPNSSAGKVPPTSHSASHLGARQTLRRRRP